MAFVKLGIPPYDEDVKSFISADMPNGMNRMEEVNHTQLLKYCAIDAWAEYKLYEVLKDAKGI
jgi:hypothetical protein